MERKNSSLIQTSYRMARSPLIFLIPFALSIATLALLIFGLQHNWLGAAGFAALEFCEASQNHFIKQPANAWSNLAFTFCGWMIGWQAFSGVFNHKNNRMASTFFFPCFMASICVIIGTGSLAMHASTSIVGGYFDMLSMYLMAALMFAYAFIRYLDLNETSFFMTFLLVLVLTHILHFANHFHGPVLGVIDINATFGLFAVSAIAIEILYLLKKRPSIDNKWILRFIAMFLVSVTIWAFSKTGRILCDPESLIQGHAIWHILDACCLYFLYRYWVSEEAVVISDI